MASFNETHLVAACAPAALLSCTSADETVRWMVKSKRLAFMIRDVAMSAPVVHDEIPNGRSSFAPGRGSSTTAEQFGALAHEDMARVPALR
jgi:hypothetical protein